MHPEVHVYYNSMSWWLQRWFMPAVNRVFYSWYNTFGARTGRTPPATPPPPSPASPASSHSVAPSTATGAVSIWSLPPVSVECGLHIPDDLTPYSLLVFGGMWALSIATLTWVVVRGMRLCSDAVHPMTVRARGRKWWHACRLGSQVVGGIWLACVLLVLLLLLMFLLLLLLF
jgi:hypothetical protein